MDGIHTSHASGSPLSAAQALVKRDRAKGFALLNDLFRNGSLPNPALNGRYRGELIALDVVLGLTQFFQGLANLWMPWQGKVFDSSQQRGENILTNDSYLLARFFNPFYRGFRTDGANTYRAFAFRTYTAPGVLDEDRTVLKIDHDLQENPAPTVRRVLDELVQVDDHLYLGKAHVHWWWRGWQTVAYFRLTPEKAS